MIPKERHCGALLVTNVMTNTTVQIKNAFMVRPASGQSIYGCDFTTVGTNLAGRQYKKIIVLPLRDFKDQEDEQRHFDWFIRAYAWLASCGEFIWLSDRDIEWWSKKTNPIDECEDLREQHQQTQTQTQVTTTEQGSFDFENSGNFLSPADQGEFVQLLGLERELRKADARHLIDMDAVGEPNYFLGPSYDNPAVTPEKMAHMRPTKREGDNS